MLSKARLLAAGAALLSIAAGLGMACSDEPELHSCEPLQTEEALYVASTPDGRSFVALHDLVTGGDRVFFGPAERVAQRKVLSSSYDTSLHLVIDLDGKEANVQLVYANTWEGWGRPRLEPPGQAPIPLTPVPGSPGEGWDVEPTLETSPEGGTAFVRPIPPPRKSTSSLTAGLRFHCF